MGSQRVGHDWATFTFTLPQNSLGGFPNCPMPGPILDPGHQNLGYKGTSILGKAILVILTVQHLAELGSGSWDALNRRKTFLLSLQKLLACSNITARFAFQPHPCQPPCFPLFLHHRCSHFSASFLPTSQTPYQWREPLWPPLSSLPLCSPLSLRVLWVRELQKGWVCAAQFCRPLDKRRIRSLLLLRNCERYRAKPFSTPNSRGTILVCRGSQQVSKSLLKEMQYEKSFGFPSSSNTQVLSTCATKPPVGARERGRLRVLCRSPRLSYIRWGGCRLPAWGIICSPSSRTGVSASPDSGTAAAAAKSLQSCPTLCDPIDGSPPGSPVPGILQARTLEWVASSFSNAWKWKVKVKPLSRVRPSATPWTAACQAPPSMGFSRQEYWSGVPLPSLPKQSISLLYTSTALCTVALQQFFEFIFLNWSIVDLQYHVNFCWAKRLSYAHV